MVILIIILLLFTQSCFAQFNTPVFPALDGDELLDSLVSNYKPVTVLTYSEARDTLYANIDSHEDSLTCVYSGHTIYLDPSQDPTQAAFMNGSSNGINTEHTFPQSFGASDGNARSDMHHLFPTRSAVNSARGNKAFGEIDDSTTDQWYYQNFTQTNIPLGSEIDLYSETDSGSFEPREDHKGDVARAIFYFYTMYKAEADEASDFYFDIQRETLCDWHLLDPVDDKEYQRTMGIAGYQENKPNPFVLDCSLLSRSYCSDQVCNVTSIESEPIEQLTLSPNPAIDFVRIEGFKSNDIVEIEIFNSAGRLVRSISDKLVNGTALIDVNNLIDGQYQIVIHENSVRKNINFFLLK